jgi:hypothetical protein
MLDEQTHALALGNDPDRARRPEHMSTDNRQT